jgi:hypothetical protein
LVENSGDGKTVILVEERVCPTIVAWETRKSICHPPTRLQRQAEIRFVGR